MSQRENDSPPADACGNCGIRLLGPHCWRCGQPVKGLVRPLSSWIADILDTLIGYDGRLWKTLTPLLLRPGFLSREYIAGRRVRYVTPVRLFLFLTIALFVAIRLGTQVTAIDLPTAAPDAADAARIQNVIDWLPRPERDRVLADALSPPLSQPSNLEIHAGDTPQLQGTVEVSWLPDRLNRMLSSARQQMAGNLGRIEREPEAFVKQALSVSPQTLLLILPLFALLLKLLYLFSGRLYLQHLLVALHSHSFIALALLLIVIANALAGVSPAWLAAGLHWFTIAIALWIPLDLLLTQKWVYQQGWPMTLAKFAVAGLCYLLLLAFASLLVLLLSLLIW